MPKSGLSKSQRSIAPRAKSHVFARTCHRGAQGRRVLHARGEAALYERL